MKVSQGFRVTDWQAIERHRKPSEGDDEVELIVVRAWEEIVKEALLKTVEQKAAQLRTAWPRVRK